MKRAALALLVVACGKGESTSGSSASGSSASGSSASGSSANGSSASGSSAGASSGSAASAADPALDPWELAPGLLERPTVAVTNGKPVTIDGVEVRIDGAKLTATKGTSESIEVAFGPDGLAEVALLGQGYVVTKTASGFDVAHIDSALEPEACRERMQRVMHAVHVAVPTPLGDTTANGIVSVRAGGWIAKCGTQSKRVWFQVANGTGRAVDAKDITKPAGHKPVAEALLPAWTCPTGPHVTIDTDGGAKTLGGVSLRYRDGADNFAHPRYEIVAKVGGKSEIFDVMTTGRDAEFRAFGRGFVVSHVDNDTVVTQVTPSKVTCPEAIKAVVDATGIDEKTDDLRGFTLDAGFLLQYYSGWRLECGGVTSRVLMRPTLPYKVIP